MAVGSDPLVWLDMEMTGLDPAACVPLEVAIIVTSPELEELDELHRIIHQPESSLATMSSRVRRMHTDNGLLERVKSSEIGCEQAESAMTELIAKWCGAGRAVLAGNSIHQDRRFIVRYFPRFESMLHYRMVDVTTIKELVRRWYGEEEVFAKPPSKHTALADARASIAELTYYRQHFMKPPA